MMIPQAPNHDGKPQDGRSYQWGDPGPSIGKLLSVTSTFGVEQFPDCSFLGSEGAAWYRHDGAQQFVRFADAPYALEALVSIDNNPSKTIRRWSLLNAHYQPLFETTKLPFGRALELAHAKFWVPQLIETIEKQPPLRMYGAQPRYIALSKDSVEIQQAFRRDVVKPSDLTVTFDDGDLVLLAEAFYEARFLGDETTNTMILTLLLRTLGAGTK